MEKDVVYLEKNGAVGVIYLNQPKKKNAISAVMMDLIIDYLNDLDDEIRVIVLRGAGENFCAGGDLDQPGPKPMTAEFSRKSLRRYLRTIRAIRSTSKPVIAMVRGYAVGGAVQTKHSICSGVLSSREAALRIKVELEKMLWLRWLKLEQTICPSRSVRQK